MPKNEEFSLKRLLDIKPELKAKKNLSSTQWVDGKSIPYSIRLGEIYQMVNFHLAEEPRAVKIGKNKSLDLVRINLLVEIQSYDKPENMFVPVYLFQQTHFISRKIDFINKMVTLIKKPNVAAHDEKEAIAKVIWDSVEDIKNLIANFK